MNIKQGVVIFSCSLLLMFVLVELSLRSMVAFGYLVEIGDNYFRESKNCPFELKKLFSGQLVRQGFQNTVHTNSHGLRGPELDRREKIFLIGDSMTFGFGVNDDETISHNLQGFLDEYQIVNAGFSCGYSPDSYSLILDKFIPEIRPKVVIVDIFQNDLDDVKNNAWEINGSGAIARVKNPTQVVINGNLITKNTFYHRNLLYRWMLQNLFALKLAKRLLVVPKPLLDRWEDPDPYKKEGFSENDVKKYRKSLDFLYQVVVLRHKTPLVIFLMGGKGRKSLTYPDKLTLETLGKRKGVSVVYFHQILYDYKYYIPGDGHYNRRGTKKVAELLYGALLGSGLLTRSNK